jgi:hypothetical protein
MPTFPLSAVFEVECLPAGDFIPGTIYHVVRNSSGGANLTPIAQFFCWRPTFIEGFNSYWRVDCYIREHSLSPEPEWTGQALASGLLHEGYCAEPLWVSWHRSSELGGKAYGDVFEND